MLEKKEKVNLKKKINSVGSPGTVDVKNKLIVHFLTLNDPVQC